MKAPHGLAHGKRPCCRSSSWSGARRLLAYRPFDGTDAAVADLGDVEVELGPAGYLREGLERTLIAPAARFNYGFANGWEAVIEGQAAHGLSGECEEIEIGERGVLLKGMLREGQPPGQARPERRHRVRAAAARDQRRARQWSGCERHRLAALGLGNGPTSTRKIELTREQHADYFFDNYHRGSVRLGGAARSPQVFYEQMTLACFARVPSLIGAIWQVQDNIGGFRTFGLVGERASSQRPHRGRDPGGGDARLRRHEGARCVCLALLPQCRAEDTDARWTAFRCRMVTVAALGSSAEQP